jgi:diaminopropionate ammonia-lyase family
MSLTVQENPATVRGSKDTAFERDLLDADESFRARAVIAQWPFHRATPLVELRGLARSIGVKGVFAKDESRRLPLKSFKMVGATYALARALYDRLPRSAVSLEAIFDEGTLPTGATRPDSAFRVVAATDGNHGNATAWAARVLGVPCTIYLPDGVSAGRERAILSHGAQVTRVAGTYDDAVRKAYGDALQSNSLLLQDTALEGFEEASRNILHGYTTVVDEACRQLAPSQATHVLVQAGVGGLAAAAGSYLWHRFHEDRPTLIAVQSEEADCILQSIRRGTPVPVPGPHNTMMGGIACGEVSSIAWAAIRHTLDFAVSIDDLAAREALIQLSSATDDTHLEIGETGVAGLAALIAICRDRDAARRIGLDATSIVLCFITEGITDPETHARFIQ